MTEEQFDLLAAPLGPLYSYEDVEQMVRDKCAADGLDQIEPWAVKIWALAAFRAAFVAWMMAEGDRT